MSELIPIFVTTLLLAYFSHRLSEYNHIEQNYDRKERFFLIMMIMFMTLFVGLRTDYNDTFTYRFIYDAIPKDVDLF